MVTDLLYPIFKYTYRSIYNFWDDMICAKLYETITKFEKK